MARALIQPGCCGCVSVCGCVWVGGGGGTNTVSAGCSIKAAQLMFFGCVTSATHLAVLTAATAMLSS
jgi:hypothetical protein